MQKMHHFASLQIAKGHNAHLAFIYSAYETRTAFYNALKDADKRNPDKLLKTFFEQGIASIAGSFVHLQIRWAPLTFRHFDPAEELPNQSWIRDIRD